MGNETYLNHPTFGLLFRVCSVEDNRELFTTLYAQRLFFLVKNQGSLVFEPLTRSDARMVVESRMRQLRRQGIREELYELQRVHKQTFQ
jgi:PII interaction protein X